jgi:hypothetical protein
MVLLGIACALVSIPACRDGGNRQKAGVTTPDETSAILSGRVVDLHHRPRGIDGALVRGRNEPVSVFSARTAPDGSFQVTVPDGTHVVTAQAGGCRNTNRAANTPFSTDVRIVVENGQVTAGAQPAADGSMQLPLMYMDCRILPVVSIRAGGRNSVSFTLFRTGPTDEPLTVFFKVAAVPQLFRCRVNGDSFTFPPGASVLDVFPVIPAGAINFAMITATLQPAEDYEIGARGSATQMVDCGA